LVIYIYYIWICKCQIKPLSQNLFIYSGQYTLDGATPLHFAAAKGNASVTEQLVAARCNVNSQDRDGTTPLFIASKHGPWTPLFKQATKYGHAGNAAVIRQLIAARCNVDLQDKHGYTPLLIAAEFGQEAVTEQLIAARCNVDLQTSIFSCICIQLSRNSWLQRAATSIFRWGGAEAALIEIHYQISCLQRETTCPPV
jgi:ankyrin repeat protein